MGAIFQLRAIPVGDPTLSALEVSTSCERTRHLSIALCSTEIWKIPYLFLRSSPFYAFSAFLPCHLSLLSCLLSSLLLILHLTLLPLSLSSLSLSSLPSLSFSLFFLTSPLLPLLLLLPLLPHPLTLLPLTLTDLGC